MMWCCVWVAFSLLSSCIFFTFFVVHCSFEFSFIKVWRRATILFVLLRYRSNLIYESCVYCLWVWSFVWGIQATTYMIYFFPFGIICLSACKIMLCSQCVVCWVFFHFLNLLQSFMWILFQFEFSWWSLKVIFVNLEC